MFDLPKTLGCCLCCGEAVYEVLDRVGHGPLEGHPSRLGRMLDTGTQVEFLMSDGSEVDITFCHDCAVALTPTGYQSIWQLVLDRTDLSIMVAGRRSNERRMLLAPYMAVWPVAVLRRRRERPDGNGLMVDRRDA